LYYVGNDLYFIDTTDFVVVIQTYCMDIV